MLYPKMQTMPNNAPQILALDTATQSCTVALARGEELFFEAGASGAGHSEAILSLVDAALKRGETSLSDCDAIAFGAGPGAFTGLRVACGVAQGLAWAKEKKVVPVGNLEALALQVLKGEPAGARVLVCLDARMHQSYCAVYEKGAEGEEPLEVEPPRLANPEDLPVLAREKGVRIAAGSAIGAFPEAFAELSSVKQLPEAAVTAEDIARLALILYRKGAAVSPELAAPLYIRNRVALTIEQRAAGEKL